MKLSRTVSKLKRGHDFYTENLQRGNNSAQNEGKVNVVNLCTSPGHALHFYQVL